MIVSKVVTIKISGSNSGYWRNLGYDFPNPAARWGIVPEIEVSVKHLKDKSNVKVECWCESCEEFFDKKISNDTQYCVGCQRKLFVDAFAIGNTRGSTNKGKKNPKQTGPLHHRWNPDKPKRVDCVCGVCSKSYSVMSSANTTTCRGCSVSAKRKGKQFGPIGETHPRHNPNLAEFRRYVGKVHELTRKLPLHLLENSDKPRGRNGVEGAYQLDHIVSAKYGFENGLPAEQIADIENLQFLPWKENREKWHKVDQSLATKLKHKHNFTEQQENPHVIQH